LAATYDYVVIVALDEEAGYFSKVVECGRPFALQNLTVWNIEIDTGLRSSRRACLVGRDGPRQSEKVCWASDFEVPPKIVANLGIAGRVDEDLLIGDVVVPGVCFDLTAGGKIGGTADEVEFFHAPEQRLVEGDLVKIAHTHLKINSRHIDYINERLKGRFSADLFPERGIRVIARPIACVANVGANDRFRASVRTVHRAIAAMDMESAGILEATSLERVPTICVRGISDGADFNKKALELGFKDENRRLALEAALAVLEATFLLRSEGDKNIQVTGLELLQADSLGLPAELI